MNDRRVVLAVVLSLACVALVIVLAVAYLAAQNKTMPNEYAVLASTAVGAIAGILATSATRPPQ